MGNTHLADDDEDGANNKMIIGIDFGTTYSGVAYAFSAKPDDIYLVKDWPGAKGLTYDKCPTVLRYDDRGAMRWGYDLDATSDGRIEAIKLLLDPEQQRPLYVPAVDAEYELERIGKPPSAVATDYIKALVDHATGVVAAKYPAGYLDLLKKEYILTVPAVWSDKAQTATSRAARNAGIHPVKLVKEPEAAALFTMTQMGDKGLSVGDAFVVCDAGGGTVDLITYEVVRLKPLEVKEIVAARGDIAGSRMINARFEEFVKHTVGEREMFRLRDLGAYTRAMKHFNDSIKPGFYTSEEEEQYVNFPKAGLLDQPRKGLSKDTITITKDKLKQIFDPIIDNIDQLVSEQMDKACLKRVQERHPKAAAIRAIFLVGGFGASAYLLARIKDAHPGTQVIQPNDAWSAIVRGAVMSGLPRGSATVTSSIAAQNYGVSAGDLNIDPVLDAGQPRWFDPYIGKERVCKMAWYIYKGDSLDRFRPIESPFVNQFSEFPTHAELQIENELLSCDHDTAPRHADGRMKTNCTVETDLSVVPKEHFEKKSRVMGDGSLNNYLELSYGLVVTIQSGPMMFSMKCRGKEYGSVEVSY